MKALYLDGRQSLEVILDGPALRVRGTPRADGRYPLSRLARVVTLGRVDWRPHALLACFHFRVPVAVLDNRGRFVRLRFAVGGPAHGMARHLAELLEVPRYERRYRRWLRRQEAHELAAAARFCAPIHRNEARFQSWQAMMACGPHARARRAGRYYACLRGLTMAHIAAALSRIGLPSDPEVWSPQEWRLLNDLVRLEQWRHVELMERLISNGVDHLDRCTLTAAFESQSAMRERRIAAWRQALLLEMLGAPMGHLRNCDDSEVVPLSMSAAQGSAGSLRLCGMVLKHMERNGVLPMRARHGSIRASVRLLRRWMKSNWRTYEHL